MQAEMNESLAKAQLVSALALRQSKMDAEQLGIRDEIARQQLAGNEDSIKPRIAVQQSQLDQARAVMRLKQRQRDDLKVRAGLDGILQLVPVEVGQQVAPGTNLARVANPGRLKAEIKIAETQAKDIQIGQKVSVDTRNGIVTGIVTRIDPSVQNGTITVDVGLVGDLPRGAVPDLTRGRHGRARADGGRRLRGAPGVRSGTKHRSTVQGGQRRQRQSRASEDRPHLGERGGNPLRIERRRPGRVVRYVHVGRVRSRPPSIGSRQV